MKTVQFTPSRLSHGADVAPAWESVREHAPALKQFASRQTRERPLLIAGSLVALGIIPVAAFASRRVLNRTHLATPAAEIELPRNQEWYPWE